MYKLQINFTNSPEKAVQVNVYHETLHLTLDQEIGQIAASYWLIGDHAHQIYNLQDRIAAILCCTHDF